MRFADYYGVYTTYNIYDSTWYAFSRDDANKYWNGEPCTKGKGSSPKEALTNYNEKLKANITTQD